MPNIIHELVTELARVQTLLPRLEPTEWQRAQDSLHFGRESMALNDYGAMREALDDLRVIMVKTK
ncbi:MAG: hypothetical protein ACRD4V_07625 [Candidatus Acidiferrales bacterium]